MGKGRMRMEMSIVGLHSGFWMAALILFLLSYVLLRSGKMRLHAVVNMILRLDYLLVLGTGIYLIGSMGFMRMALVKGALAFVLIGLMESILTRGKKGKSVAVFWVAFVVDLAAVLYMGFVVLG